MKKIFLSLLLGFVGLISFGNCYYLDINGTNTEYSVGRLSDSFIISGGSCINMVNSSFNPFDIYSSSGVLLKNGSELKNSGITFYCSNIDYFLRNKNNSDYIFHVMEGGFYIDYDNSCPVCETCPEVNTGDILSGSCDTNYCVENDLCPVPSNFSQLFINDLEFPGKPLINVNIPDYIHWDYSSNDTGFDLYVGSGYDQDYIDSVLKINSYRPDSSDFTNIFVSGLTLIFPYLIFALFILFMRKLIKRIFKH